MPTFFSASFGHGLQNTSPVHNNKCQHFENKWDNLPASLVLFFWKLSGHCGRLPFQIQIFQAWYLSSGKIWDGRDQIHRLTLEVVGLFHLRTFCFLLGLIRILFKQEGMRSAWEYPFAVAGINVSFMLIQMLDLYSAKPKSLPGVNFLKILSEDEAAFDVLYCIAFQMMDAQWLAMRASYLQFKEVIHATRIQLERELSLDDIHRIRDLPAYNLLYK
ncbi:uncharacterized protein LOC120267430 isoform X3 [Dioscorea cayenensis subsp. rotundata]|uniref:Uncharacterized protein LOC120267430 isoform X3 n=1 Tax=Dioscorea cayennensis subsp. rotundata TaxID=55577 RepID=A0AB40BU94_DIOCR|nr:uncharacterized protein LOC120267430 isoform X3 [Dioscorea cayenensis subsp. rotundata]